MAYPQFVPAQPNALRILNRSKNSEMERNRMWSIAKWRGVGIERRGVAGGATNYRLHVISLKTSAWELAQKFSNRTTIHGINRLFGESSGRYERSVWFLAVLLAFLGSIYVCLILAKRFNEGKFQTVIDSSSRPVYTIAFPVITICNRNRLNWDRLAEAQKRFMPGERSPEKLRLFERIVAKYDNIIFGNFAQFGELKGEPLHLMNAVNFTQVVNFMSWRCEEQLINCNWNFAAKDCCEMFLQRRSEYGICWAFNTLESDEGRLKNVFDPFYPWHISGAGPQTGLVLRVMINPEKHLPNATQQKGISLMISEPNTWQTDPYFIPQNTRTIVEIEPTLFYYDNGTRSISSDQRNCVFDDERNSDDFKSLNGYIYMYENCNAECHQEYLVQYCNCTMDLLYPPGPYPICRATDLLCLAQKNDKFIYIQHPGEEEFVKAQYEGMHCKCLSNCFALYYVADIRPTYIPIASRNNISFIDLDIHYRFEGMMVYRTSFIFDWVDLIVAFGGIAGLFLGCSLISAMELIYFTLIELPKFIVDKYKATFRQRSNGTHHFNNNAYHIYTSNVDKMNNANYQLRTQQAQPTGRISKMKNYMTPNSIKTNI